MTWFSVHDILPPDPIEGELCYEDYIVYCQYGAAKLKTILSWTELGWLDVEGANEQALDRYVTHWTTLPEDPEEET